MLMRCVVVATGVACGSALAQVNPPPTWGQNDGFSVSLCYTFPTAAFPPAPDLSVAWAGWGGTQWTRGGGATWIPQVTTQSGVWGLPSSGNAQTGVLSLRIANQIALPEKQMWLQYSRIVGSGSGLGVDWSTAPGFTIGPQTVVVTPLAGGWERVTSTFSIRPQPPFETVTFRFTTAAGGGPVAIDDLYIHSHCVPTPGVGTAMAMAGAMTLGRRRRR